MHCKIYNMLEAFDRVNQKLEYCKIRAKALNLFFLSCSQSTMLSLVVRYQNSLLSIMEYHRILF